MLAKVRIQDTTKIIPVDSEWLNMIQYVQNEVPFGKITIEFRDGKPFEATIVKQTIRF